MPRCPYCALATVCKFNPSVTLIGFGQKKFGDEKDLPIQTTFLTPAVESECCKMYPKCIMQLMCGIILRRKNEAQLRLSLAVKSLS